MLITIEQLDKLVLRKNAERFVGPLNEAMKMFGINTPARIRHFLAQILHESGNLVYTEEIASGKAYDTRTDLGNTPAVDGDGEKYKGRGLIQCTGFAIYQALTKYFKVDFVNHPELLETPEWACKSAAWFWTVYKKLNLYANLPDTWRGTYNRIPNLSPIEIITRRVNGGMNGFEERLRNYKLLKTIVL